MNNSLIPTTWRSTVYRILNEVIPVATKLNRHGMCDNTLCSLCQSEDTILHRIRSCGLSKESWKWCKTKLIDKFGINIDNFDEHGIFQLSFETKKDGNVWQWFVCALFHFNIDSPSKTNLNQYITLLRSDRYEKCKSGALSKFSKKIFCFL
ncbi:hypothetical protein HHI36_011455 [Cryptolaemus montrouzieri]|uniref:Reverse transcriptase zinc-binding domain-containing protein n=1 Tax=Cryptolaemus montrouzieri TaxID=559131 RepID=A0ABD2MLR1_9CUCU